MALSLDNTGEQVLAELLGSATRARVLACLLLPGARPVHIRELARECEVHYSAARTELKRLSRLGLVEAERVGNSQVYRLDEGSSLTAPLRDLVRHAVGVIPLLRAALDRDDVQLAFVFGSVAAGSDRPDSDVDVLVVGEIEDLELSAALAAVGKQTGREISMVTYSAEEFAAGLHGGNSFLCSVAKKPVLFLKGDGNALRGFGASGPPS